MFSAWRILALASTTRARLASFKPGFEPMRTAWTTSNGCGGPTASSVPSCGHEGRLALGRWPLHVSGVFDTQFGDGRYDLRSDADTLDDMVHRLLAVRHR